jgi:hypothetical protein
MRSIVIDLPAADTGAQDVENAAHGMTAVSGLAPAGVGEDLLHAATAFAAEAIQSAGLKQAVQEQIRPIGGVLISVANIYPGSDVTSAGVPLPRLRLAG